MPKIDELLEQYEGEWLAIQITEEENGTPKGGNLVEHLMDRNKLWQKTRDQKRVYITYAGPPLEEDYAACF